MYKSDIILITMYTLFTVSNSGIRFSAHMLLCEKLDFQNSSPANLCQNVSNYCNVVKIPALL